MTNRGRIVLFTGPAAAGKSTVAEAWASSRSVQTAFFDHDHARFLVRRPSMTITRINEFKAQAGKDGALRDFLSSVVSTIEASLGCQSCQLLQSSEDPTRFVVVEVWDSIEAHQASVKDIPPSAIENVMKLLDGAPRGEYYIQINK